MRQVEGMKLGLPNAALDKFKQLAVQSAKTGRMYYEKTVPEFENILKAVTQQPHVMLCNSSTMAHEFLFREMYKLGRRSVAFQANCFPSVVFAAVRAIGRRDISTA